MVKFAVLIVGAGGGVTLSVKVHVSVVPQSITEIGKLNVHTLSTLGIITHQVQPVEVPEVLIRVFTSVRGFICHLISQSGKRRVEIFTYVLQLSISDSIFSG